LNPQIVIALPRDQDSQLPVSRKIFTSLLVFLSLVCAFSAWQWWRPYDPSASGPAYRIERVSVMNDHSFYWLGIFLKPLDENASLVPPHARLAIENDPPLEPADVFRDNKDRGFILKYWVDEQQMQNASHLVFSDGLLRVKTDGSFSLPSGQSRVFRQPSWNP
jgi:hypothetical protein